MSTLNIDISNKTIASYVINEPAASDIEIVFSGIPDIWQNKNIYSTFVQDNINLTVEVIDYAVKVPESILESGTDFYVGLFAVAYGSNSVVQPTDPIHVCVNQPESDGLNMQDLVSAILKINILSKSLATIAFSGNYDDLKNIPIVDQDYNASSERAQSGIAVAQAIAKLVNGSPEALDTLWELANALGNDPNFATTVMDAIGKKVDKADGYMLARFQDGISDASGSFSMICLSDVDGVVKKLLSVYDVARTKELLSGKVDRIINSDTVNLVYAVSPSGKDIEIRNAQGAAKNSIPLRGGSGELVIRANPTLDNEAVPKQYVDSLNSQKVNVSDYKRFQNELLSGEFGVHDAQNATNAKYAEEAEYAQSAYESDRAGCASADQNGDFIHLTYATKEELRPTPITSIIYTLSPNQPYHLSEPPSTIAFPSDVSDGDTIYVTFITGETAPTVAIDTTNTTDIDISIDANTGYEIYGKYVANIGKWIVNYSEYTVTDGEVV